MAGPENRKLLDSMLNTVPDMGAIIILVDERGQFELGMSESLGADEDARYTNAMLACFSVAVRIAEELRAKGKSVPDIPRNGHKPIVYLPPGALRRGR
jgi:fructoselysine-6-P-deglycase FrlB-like protein